MMKRNQCVVAILLWGIVAIFGLGSIASAGKYCLEDRECVENFNFGMDRLMILTHNGASTFGVVLNLFQNIVGESTGPKLEFEKKMSATGKINWTMGIQNGTDNNFAISWGSGKERGFGDPVFVVTHTGRLGIGTKNPNHPLDVQGDIYLSDQTRKTDPNAFFDNVISTDAAPETSHTRVLRRNFGTKTERLYDEALYSQILLNRQSYSTQANRGDNAVELGNGQLLPLKFSQRYLQFPYMRDIPDDAGGFLRFIKGMNPTCPAGSHEIRRRYVAWQCGEISSPGYGCLVPSDWNKGFCTYTLCNMRNASGQCTTVKDGASVCSSDEWNAVFCVGN